jgi:hypothetical protein
MGKRSAITAAVACATALAGCVLVDALVSRERPFAFNHRIHVEDEGLGCTDCHSTEGGGEVPSMPTARQCALCHDELDSEKPPERRVATLFDGNVYRAARVAGNSDEISFCHNRHTARGDDCLACHADFQTNERVSPELALDMDACVACHTERSASNACATCHVTIREDRPPPSHVADWRREHGRVVRACTGATADRCETCHAETSCESCHFATIPDSHNGHWRRRGHGLAASMDRESCATCHRPDSCDRCHQETEPLDHVGMWGAPLDRHCFACHEPLQNETCAVCHQGTPSHALATPLPPDHSPAMNCRMCHGAGQPLPHVDNGDLCTACHR